MSSALAIQKSATNDTDFSTVTPNSDKIEQKIATIEFDAGVESVEVQSVVSGSSVLKSGSPKFADHLPGMKKGAKPSIATKRSGSRFFSQNHHTIPIDKLPKSLQDIAKQFDDDESGTLDFQELSHAFKAYTTKDFTIQAQKKKLLIQSLVGCLLLVLVFILSLTAAYLSKDMKTSGDDGTLRSVDGLNTIVRTGSSNMDLSSGGDMLVHKPLCPASFQDEKKMKSAGNVVVEPKRNRRLQVSEKRRLGDVTSECAQRTEEAQGYTEQKTDAAPAFAGDQQIMGCRRKMAERTMSSRIPDEYLREMETLTLHTHESTLTLKVSTVFRNHVAKAKCSSVVNVQTAVGMISFNDHAVTMSDSMRSALTTDLGVTLGKRAEDGTDDVEASATFNDIGAFELSCEKDE